MMAKTKLIKGRKYLVGSKNKAMIYYGESLDDKLFLNRDRKNNRIEVIYIGAKDILLDNHSIRDNGGEYRTRIIKWTSPEELGEESLVSLYERFAKLNSRKLKNDREKTIQEKCLDNLFYVLVEDFLNNFNRRGK